MAHPLCADCSAEGRTALAKHVHHKLKLKAHPELKYAEENLMPLCEAHHDTRTARGE
jgi:5-methylcytosine-specific restriction endonuclease McrA